MAWTCAAFSAAAAAGLIACVVDPAGWTSSRAPKVVAETASFDSRFQIAALTDPEAKRTDALHAKSSLTTEVEFKLRQARDALTAKLRSSDWRGSMLDDSKPSNASAVPLPRARPVLASLEANIPIPAPAAETDNRTLLQKLADFAPARAALASLTPTDGIFGNGPDLAALGYDNVTAVYDIKAHAVYLPNGSKLEAHSGMGSLMDDPAHVNERMVGATPPATYDLKPREKLFHGVPALRMIPTSEGDALGRTGLLTHSYMLGPNGDSNGCVSIRDYGRFLAAYRNGEIKRLVVVPSLSDVATAARHAAEPS